MNTLFPITPELPEGFLYYPDFISEHEENQLLKIVSSTDLHAMIFQGFEAKRKVASFGYDWSFENRTLSKGKDIPEEFNALIKKVTGKVSITPADIAELLVTEYPPGSVINWHRDAPPFDLIAGISLLSDCTFKLRPHEKSKQVRSATIQLPVKRRSMYVLKDDARSLWQHSISPVKNKRYSITLRTLKNT
jgi:alkylated DNA repair dioxygenase AlkB